MTRATSDDRGAAPVDFVLVGSLLTLVFLAVMQVAIDYHVRNVLAACVADGARYAANADVADPTAGAAQANEEIRRALGSSYAHAFAPRQTDVAGAPVVTIEAHARLPLLAWFLPAGPSVTVEGHALVEPRR
ncbi:MAG TPA: TadE/TadG family type IV pilus assembly protein [Mycobacteriales bacterium]|nr:TadE/TadG family type IV pilus assembly protein [Mycobacteriales bacterium]